MNLMNGLRIVRPTRDCGANMYVNENSGNRMPAPESNRN